MSADGSANASSKSSSDAGVAACRRAGLVRYAAVALAMVFAVIASTALRPVIKVSKEMPIKLDAMIPDGFADWKVDTSVREAPIAPELKSVVEKTYEQTLSRTYINAHGDRIMLSIAYGNQDGAMQVHRPEVCYPAQGFKVDGLRAGKIITDYGTLPINRLRAVMGARNEPITYWLVVGNEVTQFGMGHRLATLKYGLTGRIPDGMLVRVSSIDTEVDLDKSYRLHEQFIQSLLASLDVKDRLHLVGSSDE
jgi:EpsI family protein